LEKNELEEIEMKKKMMSLLVVLLLCLVAPMYAQAEARHTVECENVVVPMDDCERPRTTKK